MALAARTGDRLRLQRHDAEIVGQTSPADDGIETLQLQRDSMESRDYFDQLERLMLDLALVQEQIDALDRDDAND